MKRTLFFISLLFLCPARTAPAYESGNRQVTLLELYSSEGCSSCPAADAWVREFRKPSNLWKDYVPVIFHVDYWDNLGWKDAFDSPVYTQRQQDYVQSWGGTTLFTPNVVINGKSWKHWQRIKTLPTFNQNTGVLKVKKNTSGKFDFQFAPEDKTAHAYEAHIALLGFDIESGVQQGENAGQILEHDFIVLDYQRMPMKNEGEMASAEIGLKTTDPRAKKFGIAAWITLTDSPKPVQATGGYLEN